VVQCCQLAIGELTEELAFENGLYLSGIEVADADRFHRWWLLG
jgi:hypothetical protein